MHIYLSEQREKIVGPNITASACPWGNENTYELTFGRMCGDVLKEVESTNPDSIVHPSSAQKNCGN